MVDNKKYSKYLARGEKIISVFGIGNRYFWTNVIVFLPMSFLLVGMPFLLKIIHIKQSKKYILTDRRIIIKDGVLSIKLTSAPYDKITHIIVKQDFIKRISYGIGDIKIHTAATGPTPVEIDITDIDDPMEVKNLIEELIIKERSLLGAIENKSLIRPFTT
jgi:uncharacterized membrane protein YdbT with pleckstrin-like domain